jgi:PKD repeat protein
MNAFKLTMLLLLAVTSSVFAQCVTPDFTAPATACKGQRISLVPDNTYSSYEWDLCPGELSGTPTATVLNNNFGGYGFKLELVEQGGDYYGFFLSRASNKLYRLDFGTNVNDPPLLVDLGGLGKNSNTWRTIEIVKDGSNYIGFIIDESAIYRVNFGTSVTNTPSAIETFYSGTPMNLSIDVAAVQEGNNRYLFVANGGDEKILRFKFASSYAEAPASTTMNTITVSGTIISSGLSFIKDCDKWYAVTSSIIVASVFKIAFDDLDDTTPTITQYGVPSAGGVAVVKDNNTFMIFAQSLNSTNSIFRLTFGSSLSGNPSSTGELKNFGYASGAPSIFGFAMYKVKSDWLVASAENSGPNMYRITFPQSCISSTSWSTASNPVITSSNAGNFSITLDVTNASGLHSSVSHGIAVSNSTSPDLDFTSSNVCAGNDVIFDSQNTSGDITLYDWDFGDMTSANIDDPDHQFVAGTYNVSVTATASSTSCSNTATHSLKIYPPPVADFQVPSGLVCTNNEFTFTNRVTDIYDGHLTYQWIVDGTPASTARDLVFAFGSVSDKNVELVATIPGCSDNEPKTITGLLPGPEVDYDINGHCQNTNVNFVNHSSGSIDSYSWDFDNGQTASSTDATTTYATPGNYTVSLQAHAPNGCITTVSKDLTVYSLPAPALSLDLPPFSCSGTPSQFHDVTGSMTDSNIQSWNWTFGDSGTSTGKNPTHTYTQAGQYTVRLQVTTDRGCTSFKDQQVTITASPVANFGSSPTCVNQPTTFVDTSTGNVVAWQWKIGSTTYSTQNPTHVFGPPGNYSVQLTVTGQNNCTNTVTIPRTVPVVPIVDFQVSNLCSGQSAIFTDVTASAADPIFERTWTFNNNSHGTGKSVGFSFANSGTYPVQLQAKSETGCIYSGSKQVVIKQSPVASFTMSDQSGPPPFHVSFTNTSTGATSYQWNFNDGNQPSTEVSPQYTYNDLGDHAVDLTAISVDGCKKIESKIVSVIVPKNELALEDFSLVIMSGTNTYQGYARVRNNGNYRIEGFAINYSIGGSIQLRETVVGTLEVGESRLFLLSSQFADPGANAFVCAEVDKDNDLSDNEACTTMSASPIIFNVSPNPSSGYVNIKSVRSVAGTVSVKLYNMAGAVVYDRQFDAAAGLSQLSLDVQNLSPGVYVVVVSASDVASSQKILIAS